MATTAIALVAAGEPGRSALLGLSMLALQASIGTVNDIVDAPADGGSKPGKPIPAGFVTLHAARLVGLVTAALGLWLAMLAGPGVLALAALILGVGLAYDLWAKGTSLSWVPFALGIPLLPVFAWFGATGRLPGAFLVLVPTAVVAGAALAVANSRVDVDRDLTAGQASVATRLGPDRSWRLSVVLFGTVAAVAVGSILSRGAPPLTAAAALAASVVILGSLAWAPPASLPDRLERAWELQAIGVALLAAVWLIGYGDLG